MWLVIAKCHNTQICECVFRLEVVLSISFYNHILNDRISVRTIHAECVQVRRTFEIELWEIKYISFITET
jgi:hypothetical protein